MTAIEVLVAASLLNPAVTQSTIGATICRPNWTDSVRPPVSYTNKLKRSQLPKGADLTLFEEDHFVPLELGGAPRATENLWPQPRSGPCAASIKDIDEDRLHRAVCARTMTLAAARDAMVKKWGHCKP
jgi:hypothetical protein